MADVLPSTLLLAEPNLADLFNLSRKETLLTLNCHHLGTIQAYDKNTQTAQVTVNYKKSILVAGTDGTYSPKLFDYPILTDVPVVTFGGGSGVLTFPVAKGDECLLLFNDRDIDNWFSGATGGALATPRLHSLADGIALVGVRSLANVVGAKDPTHETAPSADAIELRTKDGNARVSISADGSKITSKLGPDGPTQVSLVLTSTGKLEITNAAGEFVTALITALSTATAAGFPVLIDLSVLSTFMGP